MEKGSIKRGVAILKSDSRFEGKEYYQRWKGTFHNDSQFIINT